MVNNAEKIVIDYLTSKGFSNVFAEIPNPRPENMIVLETTGGTYANNSTVAEVDLAVQAYSTTRFQASSLALSVHEKLITMADEVSNVATCEVGVPYNWTDDCPRYQMTLKIKIKD